RPDNGSADNSAKDEYHAAINAEGINIGGNLFLREGFRAEGMVDFVSATINGDLIVEKAALLNSEDYAFTAEDSAFTAANVNVGGNLYVESDSLFDGTVNLFGARIGMNLKWTDVFLTANTKLDL